MPVRDLDHHRDAAARVGRGAPQAPRRDRHRGRSAQPGGGRVLEGPARQRRPLQEGRERQGEHAEVRARHPRRPRSTSSRSTTRSSGLSIGIAILVVGMTLLGFPLWVGFLAAGHPRGQLRDALGRDQRDRPPARQAAVSQLRDQWSDARADDRWRGAAQQPPRRARPRRASRCTGARSTPAGGSCARSCSCASRSVRHDDVKLKTARVSSRA